MGIRMWTWMRYVQIRVEMKQAGVKRPSPLCSSVTVSSVKQPSKSTKRARQPSYCCVLAASGFIIFSGTGIRSAGSGGCTRVSM